MSDSFASAWTVAHQAPLSMEFSRQEYWSGLPYPSSEDLPGPGIESAFLALAGRFFITEPQWKPYFLLWVSYFRKHFENINAIKMCYFFKKYINYIELGL